MLTTISDWSKRDRDTCLEQIEPHDPRLIESSRIAFQISLERHDTWLVAHLSATYPAGIDAVTCSWLPPGRRVYWHESAMSGSFQTKHLPAFLVKSHLNICSDVKSVKIKAVKAKFLRPKSRPLPSRPCKTWTFEAKAFKDTARAEIKIRSASDRIGDKLNFRCFCWDIHLLLITCNLLLIYYYNYY